MKLFVKAALVSAMATSTGVMAAQLQSLGDADLSNTTGQSGISVKVETTDAIKINQFFWHDNDGYKNAALGGTEVAGAVKIGTFADGTANQKANGITLTQTTDDPLLTLDIDADAGANGTTPFLNIAATLGGVSAEIGTISVVASGTQATDSLRRGGTNEAVILEGLTLEIGKTTANIQLGNTPQGAMIKLDTVMEGGLTIKDLALKDSSADGGGVVALGEIKVASAGGLDLALNNKINITEDGLRIASTNANDSYDIYITDLALGTKDKVLGDIEIQGLSMGASTISIAGR